MPPIPDPADTFAVGHWQWTADRRIECRTCPRHCRLKDGQRGFCFVRQRQGEQLILTTYGRSSGFCVDPIEKKPLHHFLPGSAVFSFGTAGCNLGCKFCQNCEMSTSRHMDTLAERASPEQIAAAAARADCASVAFTYNDPTIFWEYARDVAGACHQRHLRTVAVTAGWMEPEPRAEFHAHVDAANVDLKAFSEGFYRDYCRATLAPVLDTLVYLKHETAVWLETTTLLIPGANDSRRELDEMTRWVVAELGPDVPMHFSAFHPAHRLLDRERTPPETLIQARQIALENGVRHAFTGNIHDPEGQSTWCHACGAKLIGRNGYHLTAWNLDEAGACAACGEPCAGVFGPAPGAADGHRRRVHVGA